MLPPNRVHNKNSFSISSIIASDEPKEGSKAMPNWNSDEHNGNVSSCDVSDSSDVYSSCSEEDIDMADETKPLELVSNGKSAHYDNENCKPKNDLDQKEVDSIKSNAKSRDELKEKGSKESKKKFEKVIRKMIAYDNLKKYYLN